MSLISELQQAMVDHRFRPSPRFSQNFIVDERVLDRMVSEARLSRLDKVLEIGSGTGFLTERLLERSDVIGVELDENLVKILEEKFGKRGSFTLIEGDFTKAKLPKFNKVVALPPYNISADIMLRLFREDFDLALLVFQKEFVEKLVAEPGFREYSYITVLSDCLFDKKVIIPSIPPGSFYPKPETYSSLIRLSRKKKPIDAGDFEKFSVFVKHIFRYKNKNFSNALKNCAKENKGLFRGDVSSLADESGFAEEKTYLLSAKELAGFFRKISQ